MMIVSCFYFSACISVGIIQQLSRPTAYSYVILDKFFEDTKTLSHINFVLCVRRLQSLCCSGFTKSGNLTNMFEKKTALNNERFMDGTSKSRQPKADGMNHTMRFILYVTYI